MVKIKNCRNCGFQFKEKELIGGICKQCNKAKLDTITRMRNAGWI